MIDTHAHIFLEPFDNDREEIIRRALEASVEKILLPNIDSTTIDRMLQLSNDYPDRCLPMIGLHPCSVKENSNAELEIVSNYLSREHQRFFAVGEIGTDLYWDRSFWKEQKFAFTRQCEWALDYHKPVVIHCRESIDETIELVEPLSRRGLNGVFHCFTGTKNQADRINEMGFYLGLGGVSTFKNGGLDQVIPLLDIDFIVLETDSPYLSPAPYRGKRNEPAYLDIIAEKVSGLLGVEKKFLKEATTNNAIKLFKLPHIEL